MSNFINITKPLKIGHFASFGIKVNMFYHFFKNKLKLIDSRYHKIFIEISWVWLIFHSMEILIKIFLKVSFTKSHCRKFRKFGLSWEDQKVQTYLSMVVYEKIFGSIHRLNDNYC